MNTRQQATGTSIEWDIEAYISAWKLSLTIFFNHFHLIRVFGKGGVGGEGGGGGGWLRFRQFGIKNLLETSRLYHRGYSGHLGTSSLILHAYRRSRPLASPGPEVISAALPLQGSHVQQNIRLFNVFEIYI